MLTDAADIWKQIDAPLWLVTSASGPRRGGLIATCVNQASIVPELPRVVVGLARQHHTWGLVNASRAFGLQLLREDQIELVWRFGLQSGRDGDKFAGLKVLGSETGCPCLGDALAWLNCRVEAELDTGDRTLYLGRVVEAERRTGKPLTTQRLLALAAPDRLTELRQALERDAAVDANLIATWRADRRLSSPLPGRALPKN